MIKKLNEFGLSKVNRLELMLVLLLALVVPLVYLNSNKSVLGANTTAGGGTQAKEHYISGYVYYDSNKNGRRDAGEKDTTYTSVKLLTLPKGGPIYSLKTDNKGWFKYYNGSATDSKTYSVNVPKYIITTPVDQFTLNSGERRILEVGIIKTPKATPTPRQTGIVWKTPYASLVASDFWIKTNTRTFFGKSGVKTTFEKQPNFISMTMKWTEGSKPMELVMFFNLASDNVWTLSKVKTYNGVDNTTEVYYNPVQSSGKVIGQVVGSTFKSDSLYLYELNSKTNTLPYVHFKNLKLRAFDNIGSLSPTPTPTTTVTPGPTSAPTVTPAP